MKKLIFLCLFISGCGNWVDQASIDKAIELCAPNGGLKNLAIFATENANCNNGAAFEAFEWKVN